ncbi:MAG: excinuclease ABC subunit UvrA [Polyangiales bacterium]
MEPTRLRDATTHNLQHVDLDLYPGELTVVAGVSGAGKSSLCLDTLYAEGQRRFVESFSAYARQFLERRDRPPVGSLDPVPPAIAVDRGAPVRTSRSTVGTMTELADFLRLLWSRASEIECSTCGRAVRRGSVADATDALLADDGSGSRAVVTYRVRAEDPARFLGVRERLVEEGYRRVFVDGAARDLDEVPPSDAVAWGGLDVIVDRLTLREGDRGRLSEAVATAMTRGGRADAHLLDAGVVRRFARGLECAWCERSYPEPTPGLFSFHSPTGACAECKGFGRVIDIDWERVVPDPERSLDEGAIKPWSGKAAARERKELKSWATKHKVSTKTPWRQLSEAHRRAILEGAEGFDGVRRWFQWLETKTYQMHVRVFLSRFRKYTQCPSCGGARLRPETGRYKVEGLSITEASALPVVELAARLRGLRSLDEPTDRVAGEILTRLGYLDAVGVGYLSLDRASRTLSGGEVQRVALTAALGTSLTGTLMVLDEPTAGLHPRDAARLIEVARGIAALGNVALVIEHDLEVVAAADRVIELGPDAGERGGAITFDGAPSELFAAATATGEALRAAGPARTLRRAARGHLSLRGARGNNLRDVDVDFPLGALTVVTGVSGSGKSSLVGETLYPAVTRALAARALPVRSEDVLPYDALLGAESLRDVVYVDQGPMGRTTRGNAATYLKVYDRIRALFAATPEAKARGYTPRMFSFNVEGGRCPTCEGAGSETVEMQFLADVSFVCPDCKGRRFRDEVLEVRLRGLSVAEVLDLSAEATLALFEGDDAIARAVQPMCAVGLGYLRIGQSLSALSGGEAQRLKLAAALAEVRAGSLILLDEPTTGLHRRDVAQVFDTLDALVDQGATVIVVEHDPWVAARADHVIDLGPEAAAQGGEVVAAGTPEEVARVERSRFAPFLRAALAPTSSRALRLPSPRGARGSGAPDSIEIRGAREHNLNVPSLRVPRERLVAMTGPSGSGKSSLAFDVVYAEGQRRFLETLSPYARQYLPSLGRAEVDSITGIPPAISLEQRTARAGAMSTVATVTEVAHYLRLLFARVATAHCPKCDLPIGARTPDSIVEELARDWPPGANVSVFAPVVRARKGLHAEVIDRARRAGVEAVRVDGVDYDIRKVPALKKSVTHDVWLWLGAASNGDRAALVELLRKAVALAEGSAVVERDERSGRVGEPRLVSTRRACPNCGRGVPELDPRHFSFNTPQGRCGGCEGRGVDADGDVCGDCDGARLAAVPRAVRLGGMRYHEALAMSPGALRDAVAGLALSPRDALVAEAPVSQLDARLQTLLELGLDYLALDRRANTLSGGEMQRLRLAAQIGAGLTGVLYVLDEPTIGLHARDTGRLIDAMRRLVDRGASVVVVEHDEEVIRAADHVIDLGPGGGLGGGRVVGEGAPSVVLAGDGPTATAMRAERGELRRGRSVRDAQWLTVRDAEGHNLKRTTVKIPMGRFVCVAGVSGSGKSTLVEKVLLRGVRERLGLQTEAPLAHRRIEGWEGLKRAVAVDQSPIGRTPRSVPATYVGIWDELRKVFAGTELARLRAWSISTFSFNTSPERGANRCEACDGAGARDVEMAFLADVVVPCEVCQGRRFSRETREVKVHGYDVGDVLALTVDEAREVFRQIPKVSRALELLHDLGVGYLTLGQGSHTLSGGEAQRVKLATELQTGGASTLYVLDEPTTGLHVGDVARLVRVMQQLVDRGDSLVVIEHHPTVLGAADWLIELGPEGGHLGGRVVAEGTPDQVALGDTATAAVLRARLSAAS